MDLEMLADFKPLLRPRQRQDISLTRNLRQVETDHPFIIFAGLFDRTLGGFIHHNLFCASVSLNYSNAKLHVCYTDDRPYLADIIEMNPHIHQCWTSDGLDNPFLGYFDGTSTRQSHDQQAMWEAGGASEPDFLLVPWMMDHRKLSGFFPRAHLRIPPEKRDALQARLDREPERMKARRETVEHPYGTIKSRRAISTARPMARATWIRITSRRSSNM